MTGDIFELTEQLKRIAVALERIADAMGDPPLDAGPPDWGPHPFDKLCVVASSRRPFVACVTPRGHTGHHAWEELIS